MKFSVLDIETNPKTLIDVISIGHFDGKRFEQFNTIKDFLKFYLISKNQKNRCYAHFGGKFDFLFLIDTALQERGYGFSCFLQGSRILKLSLRRDNQTWDFLDSYSILPKSLKALTTDFDVEHKKLEFNPYSSEYLENDCKGLYEVLEKFMSYLEEKSLRYTIAGQALRDFRRTFNLLGCQLEPEQETFVRKCYYGGRVEIFQTQANKGNYYDIVSLYPYVMLNQFFPIGKPFNSSVYVPHLLGCYEVEVEIKDCDIPPVPFRWNQKLFFPIGKFTTWLCSPEVEIALENGTVKVLKGLVFPSKVRMFEDFVSHWFKKKQEAESESQRLISKLMLNSLSGKFGQHRERKTITTDCGIGTEPYSDVLGLSLKTEVSKATFICPQLSAFITSYARVDLWNRLKKTTDLFYCDTDSIFCSDTLKTGSELGQLKKELSFESATFKLPKLYSLRLSNGTEHNVAKGFVEKKSWKELCEKGTSDHFLLGLKSAIRHGKVLERKRISKTIKSSYDKRKVLSDGTTSPYRAREIMKKQLTNGLFLANMEYVEERRTMRISRIKKCAACGKILGYSTHSDWLCSSCRDKVSR